MDLWTEYEGRTIDGAFPLKKLLLPEGRSAFFATSNGKGEPTVIRLIESHFDSDEIIARWRGVEALGHPSLLKLENYGQLVLDGTTVIYAVMEPADANLADVLSHQRLTLPECRELASSLVSVLSVLHANGFVHEHIDPRNIFAVGDVVKLRSDCIRETPKEGQGIKAKQQDLRDLSCVLLQALAQEKTLASAAQKLPLPAPFDEIVRNGLSGAWGLTEIRAALQTARQPSPSTYAAPSVRPVPFVEPQKAITARRIETPELSSPDPAPSNTVPPAHTVAETIATLPTEADDLLFDVQTEQRDPIPVRGFILAAGLFTVLTLSVGWYFVHPPARREKPGQQAAQAQSTLAAKAASTASNGAGSPAAVPAARPGQPEATTTKARAKWRVVVYKFNRRKQAHKKSVVLAKKFPALHPAVFTITGHAPYLVTLGGRMTHEHAEALAQKARTMGLPRDTSAQDYSRQER